MFIMAEIKRAISVSELLNTKYKTLPFTGRWLASFGEPELSGTWIIWGSSFSGKTRFALQLAKYLTQYARVAYNSLEEGNSKSLRQAVKDTHFTPAERRKMLFLDKEPINELRERLSRHKSPKVIFIDSLQYTGLNYEMYKQLTADFRNKLVVLISHADGKHPAGRVAKSIRYDAMVKLHLEGYRIPAPASRYGGGAPFVIWPEGAAAYWGFLNENEC